jgi:hypothetical protein
VTVTVIKIPRKTPEPTMKLLTLVQLSLKEKETRILIRIRHQQLFWQYINQVEKSIATMPATSSNKVPVNGIVEVISVEAPSAFIGSPVLISQKRVKRGAVYLITMILGVLLAMVSSIYLVNGSLSFEVAAAAVVLPAKQTGYEVRLTPEFIKRVRAGETLQLRVSNGPNQTALVPITAQDLKTYRPEYHALIDGVKAEVHCSCWERTSSFTYALSSWGVRVDGSRKR